MEFEPELTFIGNIFFLLCVITFILVGLKLISKYFQLKEKICITTGIAWICFSTIWWGIVYRIIVEALNIPLNFAFQMFIKTAFVLPGLVFWIYSFSKLIYPMKTKTLVIPYLVIAIILDAVLIFIVLLYPERQDMVNVTLNFFLFEMFYYIALITMLITGFLFSKASLKSDDVKIRWKGRFLLFAYIFIIIGAIIELIDYSQYGILVVFYMNFITSIILIIGAIEYYFGFFLPGWLMKWLTKKT